MQKLAYLCLSITLHLFILFFSVFLYQKTNDFKILSHGRFLAGTYQVTIYPEIEIKKVVNAETSERILKTNKNGLITVKKSKVQKKEIADKAKEKKIPQIKSKEQSENFNVLSQRLHDHINQFKRYPQSALLMEREGYVLVQFNLLPDGHINQAMILRSSNTKSLDEEALNAIKRSEPFTFAKDYISKPKIFKVKVVFTLT